MLRLGRQDRREHPDRQGRLLRRPERNRLYVHRAAPELFHMDVNKDRPNSRLCRRVQLEREAERPKLAHDVRILVEQHGLMSLQATRDLRVKHRL